MSLLQKISYPEYKKALAFSKEQCEKIARFADLDISFDNISAPGKYLMEQLHTAGLTVERFTEFASALYVQSILTYYRPQAKVAILIANNKYKYLSALASPPLDCESIAAQLRNLGFIVVIIKNTKSSDLKEILVRICDTIPENSYCFVFYAGHGCQLCNTKCMLGVDCPGENMQIEHCVTENFVLKQLERCKLDLCIFIMDMCRVYLDRETNPLIYSSMLSVEDYSINKNLIISYSTQSSQAAYEFLQMNFDSSDNIDTDVTYELTTKDQDRLVGGASQYVKSLCALMCDDLDVSTLFDKVHKNVEYLIKRQRPIKVQCGMDKRSLYDPTSGNVEAVNAKLKQVEKDYQEYCELK